MKILMLCDGVSIGGAETHIVTLSKSLLSNGYEVCVISSGGIYEKELKKIGAAHIFAPLNSRSPAAILSSYKIIKENIEKYDIVHAHTRITAVLATRARGRRKRPGIVTTAHLNFNPQGIGRLAKWGDITLSVSRDITEYLIKNYKIPRQRIIETPNGIDRDDYISAAGDEKRLLHISRIDRGRAAVAFILCDIAEDFFRLFPEYRIEIVGGGNLWQKLSEHASHINRRLGAEKIILYGARSDIGEILSGGGIFIGVSRAVLEAFSSSLASVIAGDEGYGGILCQENITKLRENNFCARGMKKTTSEAILDDIISLIRSPRLRKETIKYQNEVLEKYYSKDLMRQKNEQAYDMVMKPRIAICGYFGFGNIGDEIALSVCISRLKIFGISNITVFSKNDEADLSIRYIDRKNLKAIKKALACCDILIMCGGNLLQNETSFKSLVYYTAVVKMAKFMRVKIYFISCGIGGLSGKLSSRLVKRALASADFLGMRTKFDIAFANKLGRDDVVYMPDLAFLYKKKRELGNTQKTHFLIIPETKKFLSEEFIRSIEKVSGLPARLAVIFPKSDLYLTQKATEKFSREIISIFDSEELFDLLYSSSFCISERLHGGILSLLAGTRCYLSSHNEKNRALISDITNLAEQMELPSPLRRAELLFSNDKKEVGDVFPDFQNITAYLAAKTDKILGGLFG